MKLGYWTRLLVSVGIFAFTTAQGIGQVVGGVIQSISPAVQARVRTAKKNWQASEGRRLQPILTLSGATPHLEVIIYRDARPEDVRLNKVGIVTALEFLLADDAFDQVRLTVVEYNPRRFAERSEREHLIVRRQFQTVAIGVAKARNTTDAINRARIDNDVLSQLCAQLGFQ
ncbi:MAG: hypothetical protein ACREH8_14205 [Opitutaceae bacterium]